MKLRPAQRFLIFLTLLACFVLSALYLKTYFRARTIFYRAEKLLINKKLRPAIRSYGRAIRWYTPGSRYVERSIHRVLRLAQISFEKGDWEMALFAYQHLYNALSSIRGLYQPFPQEAAQCRHQQALLLALLPSPTTPSASERETLHQNLRALLLRDDAPNPLLSGLSLFFFLCFLGAIIICLWQWPLLRNKQRKLLALIATESVVFWIFFLYIA